MFVHPPQRQEQWLGNDAGVAVVHHGFKVRAGGRAVDRGFHRRENIQHLGPGEEPQAGVSGGTAHRRSQQGGRVGLIRLAAARYVERIMQAYQQSLLRNVGKKNCREG